MVKIIHSILVALGVTLIYLLAQSGMDKWSMESIRKGIRNIASGIISPSSVIIAIISFAISYFNMLPDYWLTLLILPLCAASMTGRKHEQQ
ncbi:MAG: hypothetical protein K2K47_01250 [Duncaniella sp.]|nr:hypothetical protein [Duncaniella sp.]